MAVALQRAVQVGPAAFIFSVRPAGFVLALLQEGDHVMVTEVRRLVHRRAPPPGDERKDSLNGEQNQPPGKIPLEAFCMFDGERDKNIWTFVSKTFKVSA